MLYFNHSGYVYGATLSHSDLLLFKGFVEPSWTIGMYQEDFFSRDNNFINFSSLPFYLHQIILSRKLPKHRWPNVSILMQILTGMREISFGDVAISQQNPNSEYVPMKGS